MCDMLKELRQRSQKRKKLLAQTVSSVSSTFVMNAFLVMRFAKLLGNVHNAFVFSGSAFNADGRYEWSYTFAPPYTLIAYVLTFPVQLNGYQLQRGLVGSEVIQRLRCHCRGYVALNADDTSILISNNCCEELNLNFNEGTYSDGCIDGRYDLFQSLTVIFDMLYILSHEARLVD